VQKDSEKRMSGPGFDSGSERRRGVRRSAPLADAWLPKAENGRTVPPRKSWSDFSPVERRNWLIKAGLLMALSLTLVLHPSSAVRDVAVAAAVLFVLFRRRWSFFSRKPDQLALAIVAYGIIVAASAIYSAHPNWSIKDAGKFLVVLAMVFAAWHLFRNRVFLFAFLQLLIVSVLIVCIYDVVTYLDGLGKQWDWGERWVFGPYYGHPNTASAVLLVLVPVSLFLLVTARNRLLKAMQGCFVALTLFLMFIMASRTAQLSLAVMIVFAATLLTPRKRRLPAMAVLVCLLAFGYLSLRAWNPRFLDDTVKTLSFRKENWSNLSKLIAKRPVFGYGYGKRNYQTIYHRSFPRSPIPYEHAHSLLFQTTFETGVVGLAAILWLWVVTVARLFKSYFADRGLWGTLSATVLVSFVGVSIYCLAEVPDGFLRSLCWLLVAMTGALTGKELKPKPAPKAVEPAGGKG